MARFVKIGKYDHLHLGWFDLYLDLFFEEILNMNREFEIPTVAPNMARSMKIGKYDHLHLGWFDLYLDLFFEEIQNLDTKYS